MSQLLRSGATQRDVARVAHVAPSTVTRFLRAHSDIDHAWRLARADSIRKSARRTWLTALKKAGASGAAFARRVVPSAYSWLYEHDRDWLLLQNRRFPAKTGARRTSVNWRQRDLSFAAVLKTANARLAPALLRGAPRKSILSAIPGLHAHLKNLDRLPETRRLLTSARRLNCPHSETQKRSRNEGTCN